ncbi:MAG TPA: glutaredoxin [Kofleriaceae bacterium]|nr:glutaredoxin [Kofleriaceae bacterium]
MTKKTVKQKLVDAFNRADELGGDARDWVLAKYAESPRAQALVGKLRRKKHEEPIVRQRPKTEVKVKAPAAKEKPAKVSAKPKKPAAPAAPKGLGDPDLKAQVFGRKSCPWTGRSIKLLEDRKIDYDFIDLDDAKPGTDTQLIAETKQNTTPYVFLRGQFVGGYNALSEIDRLGQMDYALMTPAEREAAPPHVVKVVIVPRPNTDEVAPGEA